MAETAQSGTAPSPSTTEASNATEGIHIGADAFASQIFTLIGHEDVGDITGLQADMYVILSACQVRGSSFLLRVFISTHCPRRDIVFVLC